MLSVKITLSYKAIGSGLAFTQVKTVRGTVTDAAGQFLLLLFFHPVE